jgi:hypothetical protein
MSLAIQESLDYLKQFNLHLGDDLLENDLKLINQIPAIAVIGLVSRGKSTLVNKLIGENIMPTDPNPESYGCAFLTSGVPVALAVLKTDVKKSLPTSPSAFRESIKRSPETLNTFENCSYQGELRLPRDVMLIDTKGLSEINANFDDDLAGLDRSWAAHGAIAAVLVTSVPPGVSADDVRLFQSVHRHFKGRVVVVVKQTDSSITNEDLQETAQVWRQHGPNVVVVNDDKPSSTDAWGSGPLAGLENQITKFWESYDIIRLGSISRLTNAVENLSKQIPLSFDSSMSIEKYRKLIWSGHENQGLLPHVRAIATDRMIVDYQSHNSSIHSISSLRDLDEAFYMAAIGSSHARELILHTVDVSSPIRKNTGFSVGDLAEFIWRKDEKVFERAFRNIKFTSDHELISVGKFCRNHPASISLWPDLGDSFYDYLNEVNDEERLVKLLEGCGDSFAFLNLTRLVALWTTWAGTSIGRIVSEEKILKVLNESSESLTDTFEEFAKSVQHLFMVLDEYLKDKYDRLPRSHSPFQGEANYEKTYNQLETTQALAFRLKALSQFLSQEQSDSIREIESSLRHRGSRRRWISSSRHLAMIEKKYQDDVYLLFKWLIGISVVVALWGLGNSGQTTVIATGVFIFLCVSAFMFSLNGLFVRGRYRSDALSTSKKSLVFSSLAIMWLLVVFVSSLILGPQIDEKLHPNRETISLGSETYIPPSSTFNSDMTTVSSAPSVNAFSISDVIADGFTENGEVNLIEYFLPAEGESELKYRMAVSDSYISLSDNYQVRACWQQESVPDLLVSCDERVLVRIGRNSSGVIYETSVILRPDSPTGRWWLSLDFLDTSTSLTSPSSLVLRASDEYTSDTSSDAPPSSSTSTPQQRSYIDQAASSYANAMARWTSSGFQEMMNLSEINSPAWKYAFHLHNGRLSEIQAGRNDGSQVKTITSGSGIRICLTSSCSTLLDDFETLNGRLYDFTINDRLVRDSVITNSGNGGWVCGSFGACATLRSATWFGGTVYVNLEIQINDSSADTATRAAVVLVPPSGGTKAFTAGTTPTASLAQNAHYLVAFPYTSAPWSGSVRVKIKTALGTETLQVPLFNP